MAEERFDTPYMIHPMLVVLNYYIRSDNLNFHNEKAKIQTVNDILDVQSDEVIEEMIGDIDDDECDDDPVLCSMKTPTAEEQRAFLKAYYTRRINIGD